ncbi:MAG: isoaspartyl peptidase/L-asparaginase family protein [Candidatus Neomarinimicrobiota bacterium]|nr:MAG: glycosylasparaginase [bacterium]|tara:strand:+ start:2548 stop:3513 length:966 start_codon:yes stop_codon:yes gene_type:complete
MKRRDFIKTGTISLVASGSILTQCDSPIKKVKNNPIVLSTWDHGISANNSAMDILNNNGTALDAVESGVRVTEADPSSQSVGLGGRPDQDGHVTLDACIMDSDGNAGSVAFLRDIKHPISVARKVMKLTDHVMLVGAGAKRFALENGFQEENLLTDKSKEEWLQWKRDNSVKDSWGPNDEHDTISTLARDNEGNLSGACTTSGLAYKLHGRVGDSPIIGAGLYVDNEIGAVGATGKGEEVIKTCGSFLVVELMRQGYSAMDACEEAVNRILRKQSGKSDFQIGYIALRKDGQVGFSAIHDGFQYALYKKNENKLYDVKGIG